MEKTGNKEKIKGSAKGKTLFKGLVIGSTMTLPGVSGGSMAMVLGIYDRLLKHVSEITKYPKESLTFLLWFAAGAGSGAFLFFVYQPEEPVDEFLADRTGTSGRYDG